MPPKRTVAKSSVNKTVGRKTSQKPDAIGAVSTSLPKPTAPPKESLSSVAAPPFRVVGKKAAAAKPVNKKPSAKKAVAKSSAKSVASPKKSLSIAVPVEMIKSKHLRDAIPTESLVTDITTYLGNFLYSDIRQAAAKLYNDAVPLMINPQLVSEEYFVNFMTNLFVDTFGYNFETFLKKHHDDLSKFGYDSIDTLLGPIYNSFDPTKTVNGENMWGKYAPGMLNAPVSEFVYGTLEKMGHDEKIFKGDLYDYLESLSAKD